MSYARFGLMILTSTVVMFVLMYLNTYAWEHVFFSETRAYMALLMGATMAIVMLGFMFGMYDNKTLNIAIFVASAVVIAGALWLVRSQATVSGTSYMRAMIPHHSIAIMTSERAQIRDPRVRKLADEIIEAQRREIAEMQFLIAEAARGNVAESVYRDPPARIGTVADALRNTLLARLDPTPMAEAEAEQVLEARRRCRFSRSPESDPILWASTESGAGAVNLNGIIVAVEGSAAAREAEGRWGADGLTITVRPLGDQADWRSNAELRFALQQGPAVGYRGFWSCDG